LINVLAEAWLLEAPGAGSVVVVVTPTSFVSVVPRVIVVGLTTIVTVRWAVLFIAPRLQTTNRLTAVVTEFASGVTLQLPADGDADTNRTLSGSVSLTVTFAAWLGPLLTAIITYVSA
jgi:hypothetical protein